jgi:hypothetical protein
MLQVCARALYHMAEGGSLQSFRSLTASISWSALSSGDLGNGGGAAMADDSAAASSAAAADACA